jgi:hypothetical protein
MRHFERILFMTLFVPALTLSAAACNDDDDTSSASQQSVDELNARMERNEMLFAFTSIGNIPLHDIDEGLNDGGEIEESYTPDVRTFVRIMALTDWNDELKVDAEAVRQTGLELLAALEDADAEAAKPLAAELHESAHDFSEAVFAHVAEGLPPEEGGPEEHEEEEEETPAAEATP